MNIDASLVSRLVAAQFPRWTDLPVTPVAQGGWDNRTFHLGPRMIARLPSAGRYAAQVEKEQRWLPWLAPLLPVAVPGPLAMGAPGEGYRWPWSIYGWLEGETASIDRIPDRRSFAVSLAAFLAALHRIDTADGPPPGAHNFHRGSPLSTYDAEARQAIAALGEQIDAVAVTDVWETALASSWRAAPVWVHGDFSADNILVDQGRLSAVIDFGCLGVGDPACDLAIAWTLLNAESRAAFHGALPLDADTWARGRGWTLWKALIVWAGLPGANPAGAEESRRIVGDLLADHADASRPLTRRRRSATIEIEPRGF